MKFSNRFDNYRQISAKFDSEGACGHPIQKGDTIGYNQYHGCQCKICWYNWVTENIEADLMEQHCYQLR